MLDTEQRRRRSLGGIGALTAQRVPALRRRAFRRYWAGILFSGTASRMFQLTAAWLVYELAAPPLNVAFMLGVLGFSRTIPMLVFALVAGVAADRVGRRRMLLITSGTLAVVTAVFASLAFADLLSVWLVLVAAFLVGTGMAFNQPSHAAFVRDLVAESELQNALALMALMQTGLRIGAPLLAGSLLATAGAGPVLTLVAAGFVVMVLLLLTIDVPRTTIEQRNVLTSAVDGLRYIRTDRLVLAVLLVMAIPGLFALPFTTVLPIFADSVYGRGAAGLGVMESMTGLGALAGAIVVTAVPNVRRRGLLIIAAISVFGAALVVFALSELWLLALMMLFVAGLSDMLYFLTAQALLLARTPPEFRGRVMSVAMVSDIGMTPLGSTLIGGVAGLAGAKAALALSGSATVAFIGGVAARFPSFRRA